jgi:Permeases of the drug/metabolite transporter (DMT) superfamily
MTKQTSAENFFTNRKHIFIIALLCTALWGSAYPSVKTGYALFQIAGNDTYSKLLYAGYRFFLAGIITLIISVILNHKLILPNKKSLPGILSLGIVQTFLEYVFYYISLSHTTGIKGAILNSISTFFVVFLSHLCFKNDKITRNKLLGCLLGFAGIIAVNLGHGTLDFGFTLSGEGFMILAALFFALGSIISKLLPQDLDSTSLTGWQLVLGGVLLIAAGKAGNGKLTHFSPEGILLLFYMALISSVAFTLWLLLMRYNPAGEIAVFSFLIPIFGTILSGIFLHETFLTLPNVIALVCVCGGIYLVNGQK